MITCPKCTKDNQDHYKFCLGCGAELPRDAAPKPFTPQTPPQGVKAVGATPASVSAAPAQSSGGGQLLQPPPQPTAPPPQVAPAPAVASQPQATPSQAPASATVTCPQCGHINAPSNLFCGSCGFRLGGAAAPPKAAAPASVAPTPGNVILTALRADGSEAGTYALPGGTVTVGRETGSIFAGDSYLSPRHATFKQTPGRITVKDEASLNGVYKKLVRDVPVELHPNDMFRIGQEIIKFEPLASQPVGADGVERLGSPAKGYVGRIALVIGRDVTGNAFPIPETGVHLGRERGDVLFPEDGYVSGLHCRLSWEPAATGQGGRLMLTDLGSSNGSFLRLREETDIKGGDVLLMGQQLFRVAV
ncbi:MAG: FHA domain-containing protein [Labilithrix sp.]|nr:FHA domain-containing protein [Labilithrix sp.]